MNAHKLALAAALALGLTAAQHAQAHYLWIEQTAQGAVLRFGEIEENARETSPGRLDEIRTPVAHTADGAQVALARGRNGYQLASAARSKAILVEERGYEVKDWTSSGIGIVKPMFYARWAGSLAPAAAALPLDIVPDGAAGTFRVFFRSAPLAKAAVKIVAPNTWAQDGRTDAEGRITLPLPWRGQYVLQVIYREAASGDFEGLTFQAVRHRATLSFVKPGGPATLEPRQAGPKHGM